MKINPKGLPSFPDVAKTPASPTPVPIPYPNTSSTAPRPAQVEKQAKQVSEDRLGDQKIGTQQMKAILDGKLPKIPAFLNAPTPKFIQDLPQKIQKSLSAMGKSLDPSNLKATQDKFGSLVSSIAGKVGKGGVEGMIQYVMTESYKQTTKDLQSYKDKVQHFNSLKKELRNEIANARDGKLPEETIRELEKQLSTVGDDAQLANVDLQNALQKQQQALQTMSNVSKQLHDTAQAIIRKLGS